MEVFKKYLPWIIGAVVLLFVLSKLRGGGSTQLLPQTQIVQTPQPDPFAVFRGEAFGLLAQLGIATTEAESEFQQGLLRRESARDALKVEREVRLSALDAEIQKAKISADSLARLANLSFLQRDQDREVQDRAIERYYSSRNTGSIIGSISQAIQGILGSRGSGSVFGTPPTFPRFGGF